MQHGRPPCPSQTPGAYSNSCPLSRWCNSTISSSVSPFSSCPQSFPASESFPMNQFLPSGGQSIEISALPSVLPMNTQDWSPLGLTGWISLQSKGLSSVFSNTTVQKHQFFVSQPSLFTALFIFHKNVARLLMSFITDNLESRLSSTSFVSAYVLKAKVKVTQLCPTLWNPIDYSVYGILQARILE